VKKVVIAKGSWRNGVWKVTIAVDGKKATAKGPTFKSAYNAAVNSISMMQKLDARGTA
jgi:hypothetical protein